MDTLFEYNHFYGFVLASLIENLDGFSGFVEPVVYIMTRIENITEIAIFFSFGCLAAVFNQNSLKKAFGNYQRLETGLALFAIMTLTMMFVAGAFRTGETARACLFIYPYLILPFFNAESRILSDLIILAGLQTAAMQLFGWYFW